MAGDRSVSGQLSFFDEPVRKQRPTGRPPTAPREPHTGRYLAEKGADLALAKAETDDPGWATAALSFFLDYARKTPPGSLFATEDVRHASGGKVPVPKNARAWGNIAKDARKLKQIEWADFGRSKDPKSHGCPGNLWRFIGERV